jgi:trehalose-phosphatase
MTAAAAGGAQALAALVARAGGRPGAARTLLLDLDGTLAPIAPTPGEARVPDVVRRSLRDLARRGWTPVIVTGRPAGEARRLVGVRGLAVHGSHGARGALSRRDSRSLARLAARARRAARGVPGALVERKSHGLAFHDRGVAPARLRRWRRLVAELLDGADRSSWEIVRGKRVVELRSRGVHKGRVLDRVLGRRRPRRAPGLDASLVAVGDDRTDEDLFAAIRGRGLAVRVGRRVARTHATRRLPSPAAVARFLAALAHAANGAAR